MEKSKEASIKIVSIRQAAKYKCIATSGSRKKEKVIQITILGKYTPSCFRTIKSVSAGFYFLQDWI